MIKNSKIINLNWNQNEATTHEASARKHEVWSKKTTLFINDPKHANIVHKKSVNLPLYYLSMMNTVDYYEYQSAHSIRQLIDDTCIIY